MRRSALSNTLRTELSEATRARSSSELTEEALALFEEAVQNLQRAEGLTRSQAIARIEATRRVGRRPSRAAGDR